MLFRLVIIALYSIITLYSGGCGRASYAGDLNSSEAVEAGHRALETRAPLPWYDSAQDGLRRLDVEPSADDAARHSEWVYNVTATTPSRGFDWAQLFSLFLKALAWIALGLLITLVVWGLIWAVRRSVRSRMDVKETPDPVKRSPARVEDLPVPVSPEHTDLLAAARAYVEAGDFGKAVIYLFAHQLVELDRRHFIQLTRGKTNREYLGELRGQPQFAELLKPTMLASEDVFFGHHELTQQRFQKCWENLDRFHQQLEQVAL